MLKKYTFIAFMLLCLPFTGMAQGTLSLSVTGYDAKCNGSTNGSAMAIPAGGIAPYTYLWSHGSITTDSISGLAAGVYSVTVTDHSGTHASASVTISQPDSLLVTIDADIVRPCFRTTGGAVCGCSNILWAVVTGGTPPYSYLWNPPSQTGDSTGDTMFHACYEEFTVTVTDANNCTSNDSINVQIPGTTNPTTATVQVNNAQGVTAYPNPASSLLNVAIGPAANIASLEVYDMLGQKIFYHGLTGNERLVTLDVSTFADGNYLLKTNGDGTQQTIHFSVVK